MATVIRILCLNCGKPMSYFYKKYLHGGVCSKRCDDEYSDRAKVEEDGL